MEFTNSTSRDASHVLVDTATGRGILETFAPRESLPTPKAPYKWVGIREYLASLNTKPAA